MIILYVIIPISIIAINGPILKSYIKSFNRINNCKKNNLNRKDLCHLSKKDNCPMSSYKQCTNNNLAKHYCDCSRQNIELCPHILKDCKNKIAIDIPNGRNVKINYPDNFPRVNIYKSNKSSFDM